MKKGKILLLPFLIVASLCGCRKDVSEEILRQMNQIEQKGDANPLEGLNELNSLELGVKSCTSEYVWNKYFLLQTRLRDKAFILPISSDTIEAVVDYFDRHGSVEERMEAYYYEASVYRDLKDYPREMTAFQKVLDLAHEYGIGDCRLLQNTYSQLSGLYNSQQLYKDALEMAKAGCDMAERTNTLDPIYLMDVATSAWQTRDSATHVEYCLKTLDCLKKDTNGIYPSVVCELLIRFSDLRMKSETKECYAILHSSERYKNAPNYFSAMAIFHDFQENIDSAMIYYKKMMNESTITSQKKDAAHRLMDCFIYKKQYEVATSYATQYAFLVDSVFREYQYESTSRASGEHLYAISMKKEMQAREEADRYKIRIYGIMVVFLIVVLMGGFIYHRKREHYLRELLNKDKQIKDIVRISLQENASIESNALVQKFHDASFGKCAVEETEWQDLYNIVEKLHSGFREAAMTMPRNSELSIKTAYLLKLGMSNTQIANLTNCSRQTVWDRVRKVKKCMGRFLDAKIS